MPSSVAIEVVIEDDVFNAPELKKIGATIVVKVPPKASLETVNTKIMEQYPALRNSWNMYYFFDNNGLRRSQIDETLADFWRYQERSAEGLCVLYMSAMLLKHKWKTCDRCDRALYGRYYRCQCRSFYCCTSCIDDAESACSFHEKTYIWSDLVPVPSDIIEYKELELIREVAEHRRFWIRQQAVANEVDLESAAQ